MLKPITAYDVTLKDAQDAIGDLHRVIDARDVEIARLQKLLDAYPGGPNAEQDRVVEERVKFRTGVQAAEITGLKRELDRVRDALAKAEDDISAFKDALRRAL